MTLLGIDQPKPALDSEMQRLLLDDMAHLYESRQRIVNERNDLLDLVNRALRLPATATLADVKATLRGEAHLRVL